MLRQRIMSTLDRVVREGASEEVTLKQISFGERESATERTGDRENQVENSSVKVQRRQTASEVGRESGWAGT